MVFSSITFLWFFLPCVLLGGRLIRNIPLQNIFLLLVSLIFYAWGEPKYILLMACSISVNFVIGWIMDSRAGAARKIWLAIGVIVNLLLLGYFKYFDFLVDAFNGICGYAVFEPKNIALPIGISFYTFQVMSYVIDLYRGEIRLQRNPLNLALYVSFFPQLIAGPIVKYHDIEQQITKRNVASEKFACGIRRFVYGLAKKVILSNCFAQVVDLYFDASFDQLGTLAIWGMMFLYALQIYFDFSGYSDMAVGLGKMFGFDFMENFNYPYRSLSVREFWRRWHISLSTWFREYLYIPLGGNRKGNGRTYLNLAIVFFCTGLWHGASFNFIIWGLWHGVFLIIERKFLGKLLDKNRFRILNWIYVMLVVMVGWVFFRAENLTDAWTILKMMFIPAAGYYNIAEVLDRKVLLLAIIGFILSLGLKKNLAAGAQDDTSFRWLEIVLLGFLLWVSIMMMVSNTYNPFIYFRF